MRTFDAIEVFLKSRRAKGLSLDTLRWYRGILGSLNRQYPELPKEPEPIYEFLSAIQTGDERRHGYYRALRALYNYIEKRSPGFINPMKFVDSPRRRKKLPRPLTPEEMQQLLSYPHNANIRAALYFLIDSGARVGELNSLTPSGLSMTSYGHIARITGKTGTRWVPICPETYQALLKVLPFQYTKYRLRRLISKAFKDARVEGSGINLRHSFATYWNGDELILQQIMGHAHLSTTKIYRSLRLESVSRQHNLYSPLKMILGATQRLDL